MRKHVFSDFRFLSFNFNYLNTFYQNHKKFYFEARVLTKNIFKNSRTLVERCAN